MRRKDWKPLPEDMKLWYGDDLIYRRIRKTGYSTKNITSSKIGHLCRHWEDSHIATEIMPTSILARILKLNIV